MNASSGPGRFPFLLVLGVVTSLAILAVATSRSLRHLEAQRAEERQLEETLAATEQRVEELGRRIRRLREDPATLERLAREEMGLVRSGEVVVVFPEDPSPPSSQGAEELERHGQAPAHPEQPLERSR